MRVFNMIVSASLVLFFGAFVDADQFGRTFRNNSKWLSESCPAELAGYNCYFQNFTERAAQIDAWRPPGKVPSPAEVAERLKNKRVFLIGDSIMLQTWISLICYLYGDVEGSYFIQFEYRDWLGAVLCPFGKIHCEPLSGSYAVFGTTELHFHWETSLFPDPNEPAVPNTPQQSHENAFDVLMDQYSITADDVVIMNFGLWFFRKTDDFNEPTHYEAVLHKILHSVHKRKLEKSFYWVESTPQHFNNDKDVKGRGYYMHANADRYDAQAKTYLKAPTEDHAPCVPYTNISDAYANDVRNRIVDRVFDSANARKIKVVRVWEKLWELVTHHVTFSHRHTGYGLDCTHWCLPGPLTHVFVQGFFDVYAPYEIPKLAVNESTAAA